MFLCNGASIRRREYAHTSILSHDSFGTYALRRTASNGRRELVGDLAWLKAYRGLALIRLGDRDRGKREAHEAITVLRAEVNRTGRADLKAVLDRAAKQLGEL